MSKRGFCEAIGLGRSNLYHWKKRARSGSLEDARPVARSHPNSLGEAKRQEIMAMIINEKEIGTDGAIALMTGVSKSSVHNIRESMAPEPEPPKPRIYKSYSWYLRNVCWSMDTVELSLFGRKIFILIIMEEMSRLILGYRISHEKSGWHSRELLLGTIARTGIRPLVVKHDRGVEFMNKVFLFTVHREGITTLASPGYYAKFNGKLERSNRLVRRFLKALETNEMEGVELIMAEAQRTINSVLPRAMFGARTSLEEYEAGMDYTSLDRELMIERFQGEQSRIYVRYFNENRKFLDKDRKEVVKYLCREGLCRLEYRIG